MHLAVRSPLQPRQVLNLPCEPTNASKGLPPKSLSKVMLAACQDENIGSQAPQSSTTKGKKQLKRNKKASAAPPSVFRPQVVADNAAKAAVEGGDATALLSAAVKKISKAAPKQAWDEAVEDKEYTEEEWAAWNEMNDARDKADVILAKESDAAQQQWTDAEWAAWTAASNEASEWTAAEWAEWEANAGRDHMKWSEEEWSKWEAGREAFSSSSSAEQLVEDSVDVPQMAHAEGERNSDEAGEGDASFEVAVPTTPAKFCEWSAEEWENWAAQQEEWSSEEWASWEAQQEEWSEAEWKAWQEAQPTWSKEEWEEWTSCQDNWTDAEWAEWECEQQTWTVNEWAEWNEAHEDAELEVFGVYGVLQNVRGRTPAHEKSKGRFCKKTPKKTPPSFVPRALLLSRQRASKDKASSKQQASTRTPPSSSPLRGLAPVEIVSPPPKVASAKATPVSRRAALLLEKSRTPSRLAFESMQYADAEKDDDDDAGAEIETMFEKVLTLDTQARSPPHLASPASVPDSPPPIARSRSNTPVSRRSSLLKTQSRTPSKLFAETTAQSDADSADANPPLPLAPPPALFSAKAVNAMIPKGEAPMPLPYGYNAPPPPLLYGLVPPPVPPPVTKEEATADAKELGLPPRKELEADQPADEADQPADEADQPADEADQPADGATPRKAQAVEEQLSAMKVVELRAALSERGLKTSGRKGELAQRLRVSFLESQGTPQAHGEGTAGRKTRCSTRIATPGP